jgi:hypothetical protein
MYDVDKFDLLFIDFDSSTNIRLQIQTLKVRFQFSKSFCFTILKIKIKKLEAFFMLNLFFINIYNIKSSGKKIFGCKILVLLLAKEMLHVSFDD